MTLPVANIHPHAMQRGSDIQSPMAQAIHVSHAEDDNGEGRSKHKSSDNAHCDPEGEVRVNFERPHGHGLAMV